MNFDEGESLHCTIVRANSKHFLDERSGLMIYKGLDIAVMDRRGHMYEFELDDRDVPESIFRDLDTAKKHDEICKAIFAKLNQAI